MITTFDKTTKADLKQFFLESLAYGNLVPEYFDFLAQLEAKVATLMATPDASL